MGEYNRRKQLDTETSGPGEKVCPLYFCLVAHCFEVGGAIYFLCLFVNGYLFDSLGRIRRFLLLVFVNLLFVLKAFSQAPDLEALPFSAQFDLKDDPFALFAKIEDEGCSPGLAQDLIHSLKTVESLNQVSQDKRRETFLHRAVENQCVEVVEWLLNAGADWRLRNSERLNPLDLALKRGQRKILNVFLSSIANAPIETAQSKAFVVWMENKEGEVKKQSEIQVKVGFSLANVSERQVLVLNSALKGMYRLDERTTVNGKSDFFFNRVNDDVTSVRYLVDTKIVRENIGKSPWNGALDLKVEGYLGLTTYEVAALIERSWTFFDKTVTAAGSLGPGYRTVRLEEDQFFHDATVRGQQNIQWKPRQDFLILKGGRFTIDESTSYTLGDTGTTTIFELGFKNHLTDKLALGITYKRWMASLRETEVNDSQILLEVSYENIR